MSLGFDLAQLCAAVIFFFKWRNRKFYTGSICPFLASDQTFSSPLGWLSSIWGWPVVGVAHQSLRLGSGIWFFYFPSSALCCWKGRWKVRFLHLGPVCSFWHPSGKEGLFVNQKDFLLIIGLIITLCSCSKDVPKSVSPIFQWHLSLSKSFSS